MNASASQSSSLVILINIDILGPDLSLPIGRRMGIKNHFKFSAYSHILEVNSRSWFICVREHLKNGPAI